MVAFPWVATYFYYQNQGTLKRKWRHYQLGWGQQEQTCPPSGNQDITLPYYGGL